MAKIKVLAQQNESVGPDTSICLLTVHLIAGEVIEGLVFIAYETYHPYTLAVQSVEARGERLSLRCEATWQLYDAQLVAAVLDSSGSNRRERFYYDHDNTAGPPPL
jgi:hypothetical protein